MLFYGKSDMGKTRSTNEDNFITLEICKNLILCVICDGVGGYKGGNIASELAILTFTDYVKTHLLPFVNSEKNIFNFKSAKKSGVNIEDMLSKAVHAANTTIRQRGNHDPKLKDMGTTLIAALIIDNMLYVANVGDSRLYVIKGDEIKQITHDHSYVQFLIDTGKITAEEAVKSPYRNVITRVVGTDSFLESDTDIYTLKSSSGFILMCSDGLYNYSNPDNYSTYIKDVNDNETLIAAVDKLIETANTNGGKDNITVILIKNDVSEDDINAESTNETDSNVN